MDRFASSVLPWPYEAVALGSNRCVISYCAFGDTSYCALKTRTWCLYRASLMMSKSASETECQPSLPLPYTDGAISPPVSPFAFLSMHSPDMLLMPTPCTTAPNWTFDPGRCVSGCIEALEEAIVAYDAACRLKPPSFRRDIVFTYNASLVSELTDASGNGFPAIFYPQPLANS